MICSCCSNTRNNTSALQCICSISVPGTGKLRGHHQAGLGDTAKSALSLTAIRAVPAQIFFGAFAFKSKVANLPKAIS